VHSLQDLPQGLFQRLTELRHRLLSIQLAPMALLGEDCKTISDAMQKGTPLGLDAIL
jgi:hypothetical protein